jgi:hypothetical protein
MCAQHFSPAAEEVLKFAAYSRRALTPEQAKTWIRFCLDELAEPGSERFELISIASCALAAVIELDRIEGRAPETTVAAIPLAPAREEHQLH